MNKIFIGEESNRCDGNMMGYCLMMYILSNDPIKAADDNNFFDTITCEFEPSLKVDYTFQHKYRSKSITMYFRKEMFTGLCLMLVQVVIY